MVKLKANILALEGQVESLKADLTEVRRSQSLDSVDISQLPAQPCETVETSHDPQLSFSYVYKRNKTRDWVPAVSLENAAERGTTLPKESAAEPVFKSPERRCYHTCSIATSEDWPERHSVKLVAGDAVSRVSFIEDTVTCNGESASETVESSGVDVLNQTLNDLIESNSDTSDRLVDVKVSTTIRCRKHGETSSQLRNGSAGDSEPLSQQATATQTSFSDDAEDRSVVCCRMFTLCCTFG